MALENLQLHQGDLLKIIFVDVIQMTEKIVLGVKNYAIMMRH